MHIECISKNGGMHAAFKFDQNWSIYFENQDTE
jgi:hypothetical protein